MHVQNHYWCFELLSFISNSDNDTIRTEFENYRKDDCNFFLYGYCQGGELLLEKLTNIPFDNGIIFFTFDVE